MEQAGAFGELQVFSVVGAEVEGGGLRDKTGKKAEAGQYKALYVMLRKLDVNSFKTAQTA